MDGLVFSASSLGGIRFASRAMGLLALGLVGGCSGDPSRLPSVSADGPAKLGGGSLLDSTTGGASSSTATGTNLGNTQGAGQVSTMLDEAGTGVTTTPGAQTTATALTSTAQLTTSQALTTAGLTTSSTDNITTSAQTSESSSSTSSTTSSATSSSSSSSTSSSSSSVPLPPCGTIPFDANWLKQKLSEFTGAVSTQLYGGAFTLGPRYTWAERYNAGMWLRQEYEKLGYRLEMQNFGNGVNLVAERKGSGDGILIVSGHYDSVEGVAGADDDGSGIIVSLGVAAAMARCNPEKTVRFVGFDLEERGYDGSKAYVQQLRKKNEADALVGLIQVEMAGYDKNDDGMLALVDCKHTNNRFMADSLNATIANQALALTPRSECKRRSDHAIFWDANLPAITISELFFDPNADRNPCYHQGCDTVKELNFNFMNKIALAVTHMTIGLSGSKTP